MVNQMSQLKFSRNDESESDNLGLKFMTQSGYDPQEMVHVMEILKAAGGGSRQPEFMSSHPLPESRIKEIQAWVEANRDQLKNLQLTKGRSLR